MSNKSHSPQRKQQQSENCCRHYPLALSRHVNILLIAYYDHRLYFKSNRGPELRSSHPILAISKNSEHSPTISKRYSWASSDIKTKTAKWVCLFDNVCTSFEADSFGKNRCLIVRSESMLTASILLRYEPHGTIASYDWVASSSRDPLQFRLTSTNR